MQHAVWEDDGFCYVCGKHNPEGLKLEFTLGGGEIATRFVAQKRHQGYKDVLHGGILAMVLDEVMVLLPYREFGTIVASGEMSFRLRAPVPVGAGVGVRAYFAEPAKPGQRLYRVRAEAALDDGTVMATGESRCMKVA